MWINLNDGNTAPLTVRILSKDRDIHFDLSGGNRIPRAGEAKARSIADLRKAGVGSDRVLLVQFDSRAGLDMYHAILTALDPLVALKVLVLPPEDEVRSADAVQVIREQASQVERAVTVEPLVGPNGAEIVKHAQDGAYDLLVLPLPDEMDRAKPFVVPAWTQYVMQNAHCRVLLFANPVLPTALVE